MKKETLLQIILYLLILIALSTYLLPLAILRGTTGEDETAIYNRRASTRYVSADGAGSKDGTSYADRWDGFSGMTWGPGGIVAGDTLYVCGTMNEQLDTGTSGGSGSEITIRGDYAGDAGIIDGEGVDPAVQIDEDYIILKNITIHNSAGDGVLVSSNNCEIDTITVYDNDDAGIGFSGSYLTIHGSTIYDNGDSEAESGIYALDSTYLTVYNCLIYSNNTEEDGHGITLDNCDYATVYANVIRDNGDLANDGTALEIYEADNCDIYGNVCYNSYNIMEIKDGSDNNNISGNFCFGSTDTVFEIGYWNTAESTGNTIANNTFVGNNRACYYSNSSGNTIKNNIMAEAGSTSHHILLENMESGYGTWDNNIYDVHNDWGEIVNIDWSDQYDLSRWQSECTTEEI